MNRKGAFTLLEICIVLGALLILAAMSFAVFARLRENARQATCQSNLHQIYLAIAQYVSDNDAHFPPFPQNKARFAAYLKNSRVYECPSVPRPFPSEFATQDVGQDYDFALGWLQTLTFDASPTGGLPQPHLHGAHEAALFDASKIPVLSDVAYQAYPGLSREVPLPRGAACGLTEIDGTPVVLSRWPTFHKGGANMLLYDGHVKWMSPESAAEMMCDAGQYAQPPFRAGEAHIRP